MNTATMGRPDSTSRPAATALSTPPLSATSVRAPPFMRPLWRSPGRVCAPPSRLTMMPAFPARPAARDADAPPHRRTPAGPAAAGGPERGAHRPEHVDPAARAAGDLLVP